MSQPSSAKIDYSEDLGEFYEQAGVGIERVRGHLSLLEAAPEGPTAAQRAELIQRMEATDKWLMRAVWSSAADFSEGQHAEHPIMLRRAEWRALRESTIDRFGLALSDEYRS
jgi:hypothetical protein